MNAKKQPNFDAPEQRNPAWVAVNKMAKDVKLATTRLEANAGHSQRVMIDMPLSVYRVVQKQAMAQKRQVRDVVRDLISEMIIDKVPKEMGLYTDESAQFASER